MRVRLRPKEAIHARKHEEDHEEDHEDGREKAGEEGRRDDEEEEPGEARREALTLSRPEASDRPAPPGPVDRPMDSTSLLSITEVERLTGVSATRIRQWEQRLGWPTPVRSERGARRYAASIVPDIREAQRRISCGRSLRDEIVDGRPVWVDQVVTRTRRDLRGIDTLPIPRTDDGLRLRSALVDALAQDNDAGVAAVLAQLSMIRPDDREAAALGILRHLDHPAAQPVAEAAPAVASLDGAAASAPPAATSQPEPDPLLAAAAAITEQEPPIQPPAAAGVADHVELSSTAAAPSAPTTTRLAAPATRAHQPSRQLAIGRRRRRVAGTPQARQSRLAELVALLTTAEGLLEDDLALAIHHGSAQLRAIITALLPALQRRSRRTE